MKRTNCLTLVGVLAAGSLLIAAAGCEQNDGPPAEPGVKGALPVDVPDEVYNDRSIVRSIAESPQARVRPDAPAGAEGAVTVDDSSPEGVVRSYVALFNAHEFDRLSALHVPEEQEAARSMYALLGTMMVHLKRLENVWSQKFPDTPFGLGEGAEQVPFADMLEAARIEVDDIRMIDDDEATAAVGPPDDPDQLKFFSVRRIDGTWRISDPEASDLAADPEQAEPIIRMHGKIADGLGEIAARLERDELTTPEAAREALGQLELEAMGEIFGGMFDELGEGMAEAMRQGFEGMDFPIEEGDFEGFRDAETGPDTEESEAQPQPRSRDLPENDPLQMAPGRRLGF